MNTADRIIYACLLALFLMGILSFFQSPAYEKGAWVVLGAISTALSGALGFKFGVTTEKSLHGAPPPAQEVPADVAV